MGNEVLPRGGFLVREVLLQKLHDTLNDIKNMNKIISNRKNKRTNMLVSNENIMSDIDIVLTEGGVVVSTDTNTNKIISAIKEGNKKSVLENVLITVSIVAGIAVILAAAYVSSLNKTMSSDVRSIQENMISKENVMEMIDTVPQLPQEIGINLRKVLITDK